MTPCRRKDTRYDRIITTNERNNAVDIEELKSLVKENLDEFVKWLDDNGWTIETEPRLRFVDAGGIKWPFSLTADMWLEARRKEKERKTRKLVEKIVAEHGEEFLELLYKLVDTKSNSWWKAMGLENVRRELLRDLPAAV